MTAFNKISTGDFDADGIGHDGKRSLICGMRYC
jgi:hypothetical protein